MIALFPGTFDPPSQGHLDLIERGARLFEGLIVGIGIKPSKKEQALFTVEERVELLKRLTGHLPTVEVASFRGLSVDFAKEKGAHILLRGLRTPSDFEVEFQMALANRRLGDLETLFLRADEKHTHISSSLIREIALLGGPLKGFVPAELEPLIHKKINERTQ